MHIHINFHLSWSSIALASAIPVFSMSANPCVSEQKSWYRSSVLEYKVQARTADQLYKCAAREYDSLVSKSYLISPDESVECRMSDRAYRIKLIIGLLGSYEKDGTPRMKIRSRVLEARCFVDEAEKRRCAPIPAAYEQPVAGKIAALNRTEEYYTNAVKCIESAMPHTVLSNTPTDTLVKDAVQLLFQLEMKREAILLELAVVYSDIAKGFPVAAGDDLNVNIVRAIEQALEYLTRSLERNKHLRGFYPEGYDKMTPELTVLKGYLAQANKKDYSFANAFGRRGTPCR
jgi:hypothetical protein